MLRTRFKHLLFVGFGVLQNVEHLQSQVVNNNILKWYGKKSTKSRNLEKNEMDLNFMRWLTKSSQLQPLSAQTYTSAKPPVLNILQENSFFFRKGGCLIASPYPPTPSPPLLARSQKKHLSQTNTPMFQNAPKSTSAAQMATHKATHWD